MQWRSELTILSDVRIPRCYVPKGTQIVPSQLHGFCDISENAYCGVIYLHMVDISDQVYIALVISKSKVAPIKKLTIPRFELCGAHLLSQLLHHVKEVYQFPLNDIYAWTDSTIVLSWLIGNPRHFKIYVNNRVFSIIEHIPPDHWNHVHGMENPADHVSRGLFPSQLLDCRAWWEDLLGSNFLHFNGLNN